MIHDPYVFNKCHLSVTYPASRTFYFSSVTETGSKIDKKRGFSCYCSVIFCYTFSFSPCIILVHAQLLIWVTSVYHEKRVDFSHWAGSVRVMFLSFSFYFKVILAVWFSSVAYALRCENLSLQSKYEKHWNLNIICLSVCITWQYLSCSSRIPVLHRHYQLFRSSYWFMIIESISNYYPTSLGNIPVKKGNLWFPRNNEDYFAGKG